MSEDLRSRVSAVAGEMTAYAEANPSASLPEELRKRFIAVREELFVRGIYDPVLVRFDSYSAPRATAGDIAQQLTALSESL